MDSLPALNQFINAFSNGFPALEPLIVETPSQQKSFKITQMALNNSRQDLIRTIRYAKYLIAAQTNISLIKISALRQQLHLLSRATKEQEIFYREIAWEGVKREIFLLQKKGSFTPPQKQLVVQVANIFRKLFANYKTRKIFLTDFLHFYKQHVLPLEDRIIRIEWRKKFRSVAKLATKQAPIWSIRRAHRTYIQGCLKKRISKKHVLERKRGIFLKKISLGALSEDEWTTSALFDFVSLRGMVPYVSYQKKKKITLLKPFVENMQLFFSLDENGNLDSILAHLSAESEWMAVFSLVLQMQDLHSSNVGFVPSTKQKRVWEAVFFDGGLSLGESSRIQSVQIDDKLHHIHPLRCCFLENDSFANRVLRNSTLDRIFQIDLPAIAAWMERREAPIHSPYLKEKKKNLQSQLPLCLSSLSLSAIRQQEEFNHSIFSLSHSLLEKDRTRPDSEMRLFRQLLPRVSPLQQKSFFARLGRARAYIRLWRSFLFLFNKKKSLDTDALLFYIRNPYLPFSSIQRSRLEHLVIQQYHKEKQENLISIVQEIRRAIEPTFFHFACVLYPDLADLACVMKKLHKEQRVAIQHLGDCYRPLETDLQEVQKKFPQSEEAQIAAWIGYRMRRNSKKIFWAHWAHAKIKKSLSNSVG